MSADKMSRCQMVMATFGMFADRARCASCRSTDGDGLLLHRAAAMDPKVMIPTVFTLRGVWCVGSRIIGRADRYGVLPIIKLLMNAVAFGACGIRAAAARRELGQSGTQNVLFILTNTFGCPSTSRCKGCAEDRGNHFEEEGKVEVAMAYKMVLIALA